MNNTFDVLGTMRAIRDDKSLSTTQLAVLMAAVLRTDNSSCRVRYAVYLLARDANMTEKTAGKAFKSPEVLKYFSKVERTKREVNLWFHPEPVLSTVSDGNPVHRDGNGYRPSTLTSTFNTSTSDSAAASSPNVEDEIKERYEYLGSIKDSDYPNLSLTHERLDYFANSKEVVSVANAVEDVSQSQIETEDRPERAIKRVDYESDYTCDGWLYRTKNDANWARQPVYAGDEW